MRVRKKLQAAINLGLRPLGLQVTRRDTKYWDPYFMKWVREAKARGGDPNDYGDREWGADLLTENLPRYFSVLSRSSVVLELGPGSGRLSRHLIGRCKRLIAIDNSRVVYEWLREYLRGKGDFEVHLVDGPHVPLHDATVDAVVSHGVFEHLDFDEVYWFLREFKRVLRPGGTVLFNFVDASTNEGVELMLAHAHPGERSIFRLHHPAMIARLANCAGFEAVIERARGRISFAHLVATPLPPPSSGGFTELLKGEHRSKYEGGIV